PDDTGTMENAWPRCRTAGKHSSRIDIRALALSPAFLRRSARRRLTRSGRSDACARLRIDGWTTRRRWPAVHHRVRAGRPDGAHELSDALDHLRHTVVRLRVRPVVAHRRVEGDANRIRNHRGADTAQRLVALTVPVRASRVDLAPSHL